MEKTPVVKFKRVYAGFHPDKVTKMKLAQHGLLLDNTNIFIRESINLVLQLYDEGRILNENGNLKIVD